MRVAKRLLRSCLIVLIVWTGVARGEEKAASRTKVPPESDLAGAGKMVKELFSTDFASRDPKVHAALAKKLLEQAEQSQESLAEQYVLWREARDLLAADGDVAGAAGVIDTMAGRFLIDALEAKLDLANRPAVLASTEGARAAATMALGIADEAVAREQAEIATRAAAAADAAARASRDQPLIRAVAARTAVVRDTQREQARAKAAAEKLAQQPSDPDANLAVGRYQAITRGNWTLAIPALAKGSDKAIKSAAEKDLANPTTTEAQVELANAWWAIAEKEPATAPGRQAFRKRAVTFYAAAQPQAVGLTRAMIDKRLAEATAAPAAPMTGTGGSMAISTGAVPKPGEKPRPGKKYTGTLFAAGDDKFELCINGQPILNGGEKVVRQPISITIGDVITVRAINAQYESGFMCVFQLEAGFVITSHHSTWAQYLPRDETKWQEPAGIANAKPATPGYDKHLRRRFTDAIQADQESIWASGQTSYLAATITAEMFQEATHLAEPPARTGAGKFKGTLYATADDTFIMYLNGQRVAEGMDKMIEKPITVAVGDVITVKGLNLQYENGFQAVIKLENGKVITTDQRTWASYTPGNALAWYLPAGITNPQNAAHGTDRTPGKEFDTKLPIQRDSIWGADKQDKRIVYMAHKITAASMVAPVAATPAKIDPKAGKGGS